VGTWQAHKGTILAAASAVFKDRRIYVTGGNDDSVAIWNLPEISRVEPSIHSIENSKISCLCFVSLTLQGIKQKKEIGRERGMKNII
jgi:hypothetical protein